MSAQRTERLLALALVLLNASRPLSRSDLRIAVPDYPRDSSEKSFERMFERDKSELRMMGLPVQTVEIDDVEGQGYFVAKDQAYLPPIDVDESERLALAMAARVWRDANWRHAGTTAVRKLELVGDFEAQATPPFALSFPVDTAVLTAFFDAIGRRQVVEFDYRGMKDSEPQKRRLQPWSAAAANGSWYVIGFDLDREQRRAFRLSRIVGAPKPKGKSGSYEIPAEVQTEGLLAPDAAGEEKVSAQLRVRPGVAASLRALAGADGLDEMLNVEFPNWRSALSQILRAGPDVVVLEPKSLREAVVAALDRIAAESLELPAGELLVATTSLDNARKDPGESSPAQLGRMLAVIPWLRAHPGVTYEMLGEQFDTDPQRLRRDLELAVCTEFGENLLTLDIDAWAQTLAVRDSRGIDAPLRLTQAEAYSLLVGLELLAQSVAVEQVAAVASAAEKLRLAGAELVGGEVQVVVDSHDDKHVLDLIREAITSGTALRLSYISTADETSDRIVDPISVVDTQQRRYLHAWCRKSEALRTFRLDRIQEIESTTLPIAVPPDVEPDTQIEPDGEAIILRVHPGARWWLETIRVASSTDAPDGTQLIRTNAATHEWVLRSVLSLAGDVEVIDPAPLRKELHNRAAAALAAYLD